MIRRKIKDSRGRLDDSYILKHYVIPYSMISTSRYKHIDELQLYDRKTIKATLSPLDARVLPVDGATTYTVTAADENRIDLVALKCYGASNMYWAICYMNAISDPFVLPAGKVLLIPELSGLRKFPNPLS